MPVSMWGGIECTINRVGNRFYNQCDKTGHTRRPTDLELFAGLEIEKIRYPFLWESIWNKHTNSFDWNWCDERTRELRRLHLSPIAGLLHHGSGPEYTDLTDSEFPKKFAAFSAEFARRYPWIQDYTPINEPLTTARFCGLYGVWYPHSFTDRVFARSLIQQIKATVLAMQEIRKVNPKAKLIQTEDLGRATGTGPLKYQVDFENERRWLSFDLICGDVNKFHPFYNYLRENEIGEDELSWFNENPCPPDIVGINHYLLSNRYLDHRLHLYPHYLYGGNGRDRYVDIGVANFPHLESPTPESIFKEAWDRYRRPLAVTEVHLNGHRESQMAWLLKIWTSANRLLKKGVDFKAVTAWALLGSFDWNTLCAVEQNFYESGVFDIRAPKPRPTALVPMIKSLSRGDEFEHPLVQKAISQSLVITGAGTLGHAFKRICQTRGIPHILLSRSDLDIANGISVREMFAQLKPWAIVNTAGYVHVDQAETDRKKCFRENVDGPENLARLCADKKIPLMSFSSDLVFDGKLNSPYLESHPVAPLNVYGESKARSERTILEIYPEATVVRTSAFFGPWDHSNFVIGVLRSLLAGKEVSVPNDVTVSPTYVPDLVNACLNFLIDRESHILHIVNEGQITWADMAKLVVELAYEQRYLPRQLRIADDKIISCSVNDLILPAKRPIYSALDTERAKVLPPLQDALARYFFDLEASVFSKISEEAV